MSIRIAVLLFVRYIISVYKCVFPFRNIVPHEEIDKRKPEATFVLQIQKLLSMQHLSVIQVAEKQHTLSV